MNNSSFLLEAMTLPRESDDRSATTVTRRRKNSSDASKYQDNVIVVGAGVAGLAAAGLLTQAGLQVILLEARDRIGGRLWTLRTADGHPVELGAEFIHGMPPEMFRRIARARLATREVTGDMWRVENGRWSRFDRKFGEQEEILSKMPERGRDLSFTAYLKRRKSAVPAQLRPYLLEYISGFHAADPNKISVHSLAQGEHASEEIDGDRQFRLRAGYSALAEAMGAQLPADRVKIHFETVVEKIIWRRESVRIIARGGNEKREFRAGCAVITLPLGVLKAREVVFEPALKSKRAALRKLEMGPVIRIALYFRDRFWAKLRPPEAKNLGRLGFIFSREKWFPTWWTQWHDTAPILTGWAAGHRGHQLSGRASEFVLARALESLSRLFGISPQSLRSQLLAYFAHDWQSDPFSRGGYSYAVAGGNDAFRDLARPLAGTLFFAGEATEFNGHNGTVNGAIDSGQRAARELLSELQRRKNMPSAKQRSAARRNIKKAASAARRKRTVAHLPKSTRTALGKEGAKAARRKRAA
jgi:monoamine oxidase